MTLVQDPDPTPAAPIQPPLSDSSELENDDLVFIGVTNALVVLPNSLLDKREIEHARRKCLCRAPCLLIVRWNGPYNDGESWWTIEEQTWSKLGSPGKLCHRTIFTL